MPGFTEISPQNLWRLIGTPDAPVVLDVRTDEDAAADPVMIPTAQRMGHREVLDALPHIGTRAVVVACQKGGKLSHGAAALLRQAGADAQSLATGTVGWAEAGLPAVPAGALPGPWPAPERPTLWVTRHRPKIDRIACPWLIRRFVDPGAQILYVPPTMVTEVAERFDAIPFDIEGVAFSHDGPRCTFDLMLDRFGLHCEALDRLALVVRGADTNRHDLHPASAGLLAVSVGLSRLHRDDLAQLEAGIALYDAFYRWARDGHDEGHDWPASRPE